MAEYPALPAVSAGGRALKRGAGLFPGVGSSFVC